MNKTWHALASIDLAMYIIGKRRGFRFVSCDVVLFAYKRGSRRPKDNRSWGPVLQRAADCGLIRTVGRLPAFWRKGGHTAVWEVC